MSKRRSHVKAWLIFTVSFGFISTIWAAPCSAPKALEDNLNAHPSLHGSIELGDWFEVHGQPACAVDSYRVAVKIDPRSHIALDKLAKSLIAQSDYSSAIELLSPALRDDELTIDLAMAYDKAGLQDKASQTLVHALQTTPASARLAGALVLILANNGQLDDAFRVAEKFARLHPQDPNAQKVYLRVLVATNDTAASRPLARKLLASVPHDGEVLYLNGVLERKAGEFPAARNHLQQSISVNSDYADSHYNLGIVLVKLQDAAGAKEQFEMALALGISEPEAHLDLSKVLRTLGETDAAGEQLKLYQQVMKINADREIATSKSTEAAQAMDKGDAQNAVALYREAVEATPQDAGLQYKLSLALDRAGDLAAERAVLEEVVQIDPSSSLAQHQLGYLLSKGGDNDAAEEHFRLALRANPNFTQAWISLAATLAMKSQFAEAQEAVGHALKLEPRNAEAMQMRKMLALQISSK